jgi:hypothetical protein
MRRFRYRRLAHLATLAVLLLPTWAEAVERSFAVHPAAFISFSGSPAARAYELAQGGLVFVPVHLPADYVRNTRVRLDLVLSSISTVRCTASLLVSEVSRWRIGQSGWNSTGIAPSDGRGTVTLLPRRSAVKTYDIDRPPAGIFTDMRANDVLFVRLQRRSSSDDTCADIIRVHLANVRYEARDP